MKTLNRLVNWVNDRRPILIQAPYISAIGPCSEEIQFGLIRARRENKKILILYPFDLPWKFRFPVTNREVFEITSPHRYELPAPLLALARLALTTLFGPLRALSLIFGKVLGQWAHFDGRFTHPTFGSTTLWKPDEEPAEFRWDVVEGYRWTEEIQKPLSVGLKAEKRARAHDRRLQMGIPESAWFVGLHVRERGFYNPREEFTCRNATIANYLPLIREITTRGGWVIRLGDKSMTPLPPMERVVDYPHTSFKSDLMDMYLLSECRFYVGMSSGILDTAFLFQRQMLITNMTNMAIVYPRRSSDRGLPKHLYSKLKKRFLAVREMFDAPFEAQHLHALGEDFEMHENTPEELRDAVVEFMDAIERPVAPTLLQAEANRLRVVRGRLMLERALFSNHYNDMHNRYRIASRLDSALGSLSRSFLEANWERSSREPSTVQK